MQKKKYDYKFFQKFHNEFQIAWDIPNLRECVNIFSTKI